MSVPVPSKVRPSRPGDHELRMAWVCVALVPVSLVLAMFAGQGLLGLMGYQASETVSVWAALLAGVSALLILLVPCAAAMWYGYHGFQAGCDAARIPGWLGGMIGAAVF